MSAQRVQRSRRAGARGQPESAHGQSESAHGQSEPARGQSRRHAQGVAPDGVMHPNVTGPMGPLLEAMILRELPGQSGSVAKDCTFVTDEPDVFGISSPDPVKRIRGATCAVTPLGTVPLKKFASLAYGPDAVRICPPDPIKRTRHSLRWPVPFRNYPGLYEILL